MSGPEIVRRTLAKYREQPASASEAEATPVANVAPPAERRALQIEEAASAPALAAVAAPLIVPLGLDPYQLACELPESAVRIIRAAEQAGDAKTALEANRMALSVLDRLERLMPRQASGASDPE